jgi:AraC-like DNA-binding protein
MALWPSLLAVAGPGDVTQSHRHHNLHLVLAREGTLRVTVGNDTQDAAGVLTGPDVPHAIDAAGRDVVLLFADPESVPGASLAACLDGPVAHIDTEARAVLLGHLPQHPSSSTLDAWMDGVLAQLTGGQWQRPRTHPAVRRVLLALHDGPLPSDTSLEALASQAGLSPSRFMHAFTESTGIALRPYLRWLRFQQAAGAIMSGAPLSMAAADAGFSDAAHLSRTFKQMFGLSPSTLKRHSERNRRGAPTGHAIRGPVHGSKREP